MGDKFSKFNKFTKEVDNKIRDKELGGEKSWEQNILQQEKVGDSKIQNKLFDALSPETEKMYFANEMASYLHEEWRKTRLNYWSNDDFKKWETVIKINWIEYVFNGTENGRWEFVITEAGKEIAKQLWENYEDSVRYDYSPRMKKSEDAVWTEKHGTDDVDIANTKFEDLPSNWQYENTEAAKVAVDLVFDKIVNGEEITPEMVEGMASVVHERWKDRNPWVNAPKEKGWNPVLAQPYEKLPEDEKAKDRVHIETAIKIIKAEKLF